MKKFIDIINNDFESKTADIDLTEKVFSIKNISSAVLVKKILENSKKIKFSGKKSQQFDLEEQLNQIIQNQKYLSEMIVYSAGVSYAASMKK